MASNRIRRRALPAKAWCVGQARREKAHVPEEAAFTTKPALGTQMTTGAADACSHSKSGCVPGRRRPS
jgi:hypothetical protein